MVSAKQAVNEKTDARGRLTRLVGQVDTLVMQRWTEDTKAKYHHREEVKMAYDHLSRLLVFCMIFCAETVASTDQRAHFEEKVSLLLTEEPQSLKCFSETLGDLSCFWEEDEERAGSADQYTFTYNYKRENSSRCPVKTFPAVGAKRLFMCQLNKTIIRQLFVSIDVQVHKDGVQIHNRSIFIELIILLDPPADVRVSTTDQQGQLRVRWVPPTLKYMESLMMYEVSYATAESHVGQVEEVDGSELVLRDLEPGTQYKVRVRVKPGDGFSYDGYWSAWTDPIFMDTLPADLDPLIISLMCIISLFFIMLSVMILLSYRRFLIQKIWPVIPNPESKFQGLFSVYGGDFQEWLGQTNGGIWLSPAFFYSEERASPLEVLSELSMGPPLASPPLPPKATRAMASEREEEGERVDEEKTLIRVDSALMERWKETSHDHWLMDQLRALHHHPAPCSQSSLMESQDAYVTLNGHNHSRDEHLDDILEETLPLEVLFASGTKSSESQSDLGSLQQSSGSGRLSSQSSFEYPNHTWSPKGPGYTYMAVADSGVSMDYSPMSSSRIGDIGKLSVFAHEYKNEIPVPRKPLLTSQHTLRYGC